MSSALDSGRAPNRSVVLQVTACILVCMSESFDLAAIALSGPTMMKAFDLTHAEFGLTVTVMMAGFFVGAWGGGVLGDRYGRRRVMLVSMMVVSLFSLMTAWAEAMPLLLIGRLLTGLGIGGVMPNVLALAADSVRSSSRGRAVILSACGGSLGGLTAGLLMAAGGEAITWRTYLLIAAAAPLLIAPFAWAVLPGDLRPKAMSIGARAMSGALFGAGRLPTTVLLWMTSFLTAAVHAAIGNWTPAILAQRGLAPHWVGAGSSLLSLSAMVGALALGNLFDGGRRQIAVLVAFGGMAVALPLFALAEAPGVSLAAMALLGLTVFGGYLLLYGVMATSYPPAQRGTGVGAGVAAGRLGAVVSPYATGLLLDRGAGVGGAITCMLLAVVLAGASAVGVVRKATADD